MSVGSGRRARQVATVAWAVTAGLALTGVGLAIAGGESPAEFVRSFNLGSLSAALGFATVGAVVAGRRPEHPIGWLFLAIGVLFGFTLACAGYSLESHLRGPLPGAGIVGWVLNWVWVPVYGLLAMTFLLFPDGGLPSRRWRALVWVIVAANFVATVTHLLLPTQFMAGRHFTNPLAWDSPQLTALDGFATSVAVLALLPAAASLLVRLRRASGDQRARLRLFCWTSAVAIVVYVIIGGAGLPWLALALAWPTVAVAAGVGILRHRLFDIDVVVSRAVVVAVLAAFLTVVYLAVVVGVGTLVGIRRDTPLLAIAATAVAAVAFQPVRARVRAAADRLVYGRRLSPYEVLARFSGRLHDPVAATDLLAELVQLLAEGTGAEHTQAWLRIGDRLRMSTAWPLDPPAAPAEIPLSAADAIPGADLAQPVSDGDELLGMLTVTKRRGDALTNADVELASSLAAQAGLVLRNARLAAELQDSLRALRSSRQRLVTAHDEERRRLERDLHDSVQQHLLGLKAKLGAVQALVEQGHTSNASSVVQGLQDDADAAIGELREVARGVYPPLLAEQGLAAAIRARARSAPMPVHVEVAGVDRLAGEIESGLYFCFLEALQNVTKHAAARRVEVRLTRGDGQVTLLICDDGVGFDLASTSSGMGLSGLRDRIEAIGGTLTVRSAPTAGTTVTAHVPLSTDRIHADRSWPIPPRDAAVTPEPLPGTAGPHAPDGATSAPR